MTTRLSRAKVQPLWIGILEKVEERFEFNIQRVNQLIESADVLEIPLNVGYDIVRAAVVLLHAAFEDVLRNILRLKLSSADDKFLEKIVFDRRKRNTTITLAQLRQHSGKSVDELVGKVINAHVSRLTFNNTDDVMNIITPLRLKKSDFSRYLPKIGEMIERRHKIVHESDREDASLDHHGKRIKILSSDVRPWITAVKGFVDRMLREIANQKPVRVITDDED